MHALRCLQFDTPAPIVEAGVEALHQGYTRYTPNPGTSALRKVGPGLQLLGWSVVEREQQWMRCCCCDSG